MKAILILPVLLSALALPTTAPVAVPAGEHDWTVDSAHSSVAFRIKHANTSWFMGAFDSIEGDVSLDPAKPEAGKVSLTIPVDSLHTNSKKRDDHLKSPDFFNSKENPKITFASTKIAKKSDTTFEVTGDLELAGKKQSIKIAVEKTGGGEFMGNQITGWLAQFEIKRSDFGMTYGVAEKTLGDEVQLTISLEVTKKK